MLRGRLIAESLRAGTDLSLEGVRLTRISRQDVSGSAAAGQPPVWTLVDIEAPDDCADALARSLSRSLLADGGWYADFTVGGEHVVVFAGRVFRYRRGDRAGHEAAVAHGRSVGVPEHQLDWAG
jgi:hypothetical protein